MSPADPSPQAAPARKGPLTLLLDFFSSVRLGIVLLALLFVYSSIGSAGTFWLTGGNPFDSDNWIHIQLRQNRGLEMTEFEWFHWWPFNLMIALICVNIVVTTLRRIRLNKINAGVWMIHTGILVLCAGSVIYFGNKVEGDAVVVRRDVSIGLPGGEHAMLPAVPGSQRSVRTPEGTWWFRVYDCKPQMTLPGAGGTAFAVTVEAEGPQGRFYRQLVDGAPQFDADAEVPGVLTGRDLSKFSATASRAPDVTMSLDPAVTEWFYLAHWVQKSWALYVREKTPDDSAEWVQRPADGVPLYNDYVSSLSDVWLPEGRTLPVDPIDVVVPAIDPHDPIADVPLHVTAYLRYATMERRAVASASGALRPTVKVRLDDGQGQSDETTLDAFDPRRNVAYGGNVGFVWADDEAQRASYATQSGPSLRVHVHSDAEGDHGATIDLPVNDFALRDPDLAWTDVGDSGYAVRVEFMEDGLQIDDDTVVTMVSLQVRSPTREFRRWVFDDPRFDRDVSAASRDGDSLVPQDQVEPDESLHVSFSPGTASQAVTIVAGPGDEQLSVMLSLMPGMPAQEYPVQVGEAVSLGGGRTLTVTDFKTRSHDEVRPKVVPPELRNRNVQTDLSMVRVTFRVAGETYDTWVPFHRFPFQGPAETLRRYSYRPAEVQLPDGRVLQLLLSRQRYLLPNPVRLDDFAITEEAGGFTGSVQSIRNWTSMVRFREDGRWTEPEQVSVNAPVESQGMWFFQAEWDPPSGLRFQGDVPSAGLNYTVLGVGNRKGVLIQLLGCCIAVLGMLYAFYYKPVLLSRLRERARGGKGPGKSVKAPSLQTALPEGRS